MRKDGRTHKPPLERGRCSRCQRTGKVRRDGHMWTHRCVHGSASPIAAIIFDFDYQVARFVDGILPNATPEERAAAIAKVQATFNPDEPDRRTGDE